MMELNEYELEVHFMDRPYWEITRMAASQAEAIAIAEQDYKDEPGFSAIISVDPTKI